MVVGSAVSQGAMCCWLVLVPVSLCVCVRALKTHCCGTMCHCPVVFEAPEDDPQGAPTEEAASWPWVEVVWGLQ